MAERDGVPAELRAKATVFRISPRLVTDARDEISTVAGGVFVVCSRSIGNAAGPE